MRYILTLFILLFSACEIEKEDTNSSLLICSDCTEESVEDKNLSLECANSSDSNDPLASYQWYLNNRAIAPNTVVNNLVECEDINLRNLDYGSKSISVAVVDVGVESEHEDLQANLDLNRSFRFSDRVHNPTPISFNSSENAHGTACAGIIGATADNNIGIRGVAPNVTLVGLNAGDLGSDSDIAESLAYDGIDVSSNSWGSPDFFDESSSIEAIESGIVNGRSGKGVNYIFAPGNANENIEFQSIMSSGYVIPVSALDGKGELTSYSAIGANILLCAYGGAVHGNEEPAIVTTDFMGVKYGLDSLREDRFTVAGNENSNYTRMMNGTSAAAPMVSGVVALMLSANSDLTYRDVQYILATTARHNDAKSESWFKNGAGYFVSNYYGFGVVDAYKAVNSAKTFKSLGVQKDINIKIDVNRDIANELEKSISVTQDIKIELVQIKIDLIHSDFKNLEISLISPSNTTTQLTSLQSNTKSAFHSPWTFASFQFLDESTKGEWKVRFIYKGSKSIVSELKSIELKVRGH